MIRGLRLDPVTGDLDHDGRRLQPVADLEAIAQSLRTRLAFFRGEWFLDEDFGTPWFQTILGTKAPAAAVKQAFREIIIDTDGVLDLKKLELSEVSARNYLLRFTVTTDLGELTLEVPTAV